MSLLRQNFGDFRMLRVGTFQTRRHWMHLGSFTFACFTHFFNVSILITKIYDSVANSLLHSVQQFWTFREIVQLGIDVQIPSLKHKAVTTYVNWTQNNLIFEISTKKIVKNRAKLGHPNIIYLVLYKLIKYVSHTFKKFLNFQKRLPKLQIQNFFPSMHMDTLCIVKWPSKASKCVYFDSYSQEILCI